MPDYALCEHANCPLATTCRRNTKSGTKITPHQQAWFSPPVMGTECEWFMETPPENKQRPTAKRKRQ